MEVVIYDNCSSDDTADRIGEAVAGATVPIKVVRASFNRVDQDGFRFIPELVWRQKSEYVAILDGDDYWTSSTKLSKSIEVLESDPQIALCHHRYRIQVGEASPVDHEWPPPWARVPVLDGIALAECNFVANLSAVFRRSSFPPALPGFENLAIADYPLWGILTAGSKIGYIDEPLGVYRIHGTNYFAETDSEYQAAAVAQARLYVALRLQGSDRAAWVSAAARDLDVEVERERLRLASRVEELGSELLRQQGANLMLNREVQRLSQELVRAHSEAAGPLGHLEDAQ